MPRIFVFTVTLCLLAASAHAEKKVYSCKDAAGNAIFSPNPCGTDAKELNVDAGRAPAVAAPAVDGKGAPQSPPHSDALQDISDSVADSNCRSDAKRAAFYFDDSQIKELERRRHNLEVDASYANNNLPGAVYESGIRKQIGDIDVSIAQERARITQANTAADATYRATLAECDKRKAEREKARAQAVP
jgi:hypothetical protein